MPTSDGEPLQVEPMYPPVCPPDRPLFDLYPRLRDRLPWIALGALPTPVEPLDAAGGDVFVKHDGLSSPVYGGNKVRTLEVLFGEARARGARTVWSTGAFGSNHAVAAALHAPRAGLDSGALLFPQPVSAPALENAAVSASHCHLLRALPHWSTLPFAMWQLQRHHPHESYVMPPGGATPRGALGYASAALELCHQVAAGALPPPRAVVVAVGSTCTSAGLLAGFHLAARLGLGLRHRPQLVAVRVTPWPVTSTTRIAGLAVRTGALLATLSGDARAALTPAEARAALRVDGRYLGGGYGVPTAAGRRAIDRLGRRVALDTTYSAKAAAALLDLAAEGNGPLLFWATKSAAPVAPLDEHRIVAAPPRLARWITRARRSAACSASP